MYPEIFPISGYHRPHSAEQLLCKLFLRKTFRKYCWNITAFIASCWFGNFEPRLFYFVFLTSTHADVIHCAHVIPSVLLQFIWDSHKQTTQKRDKITREALSHLSVPQKGPFDLERKTMIWFLTISVLLWSDIPAEPPILPDLFCVILSLCFFSPRLHFTVTHLRYPPPFSQGNITYHPLVLGDNCKTHITASAPAASSDDKSLSGWSCI